MADITINIPLPVLSGGATFQYRYRELPAGAWSAYDTETTQNITLTGLTAGQPYELEVSFVTPEGQICPAVVYPFTISEDYSCVEADLTITQVGDNYRLNIDWYYAGSPVDPSPCGYIVEYGLQGQTPVSQHYTTLPVSPIVYPVGTLGTYVVTIYKNNCDGSITECFRDTVEYTPPECTNGVVSGLQIVYLGNNNFVIRFNITQSSPTTVVYYVYREQTNFNGTGLPDAGATYQFNADPTSTNIVVPITPNLSEETIYYNVVITDKCGSQIFVIDFTLT